MNNGYATISQHSNTLVLENEQAIEHNKCSLSISFVKTLRIPDNNQKYNLPPGLGNFPLKHVEDYPKVPEHWQSHGGVFLPMYQSEAMWLKFNSQWPFAIKIAAGKINAVSGEEWHPELKATAKNVQQAFRNENFLEPATVQHPATAYSTNINNTDKKEPKFDYLVAPTQPWLDGFNVGKGLVRQFVAMPLGEGYTVEEQLTDKAEVGGIQIIAYPMKKEIYEHILEERKQSAMLNISGSVYAAGASLESCSVKTRSLRSRNVEMGLGAGGFMKQEIYEDKYGIDAWDTDNPIRVFVHLVNSEQYSYITGEAPPSKPVGIDVYKQYNYPWFDYYSDEAALDGSSKLAKIDSVASIDVKQGKDNFSQDNSFVQPTPHVIGKKTVKNGNW